MWKQFIQIEDRIGEPISANGAVITPVARVLHVAIPGLHGGLIWNRPVAVHVRTAAGEELTVPVRDVTRQVQWGLLASGFINGLLVGLVILLVRRLLAKRKS